MSQRTLSVKTRVFPDPAPAIRQAGSPIGCPTAANCSSLSSDMGIYSITNTQNCKRYIGSAVCFRTRWNHHRSDLRNGKHYSLKLQRAWNKYGESAFEFEVLFHCTRDSLFQNEGTFIATYDAVNRGYNAETLVRGRRVTSEKTRRKLARAGRRRRQSTACRAKLSALKKGIPLSETHKAALRGKRGKLENVRLSKLGKKNPNFGKPRSEETKRKIREANRRTWRAKHSNHLSEV